MSDPENTLRDSPVDFETAVAYALHPEMRRLLIIYAVGSLLVPLGLGTFVSQPPFTPLLTGVIQQLAGLAIAVFGALLLFAGLVGAAFKLVTDANVLAAETIDSQAR
ncbi:hypothetical protein SAMN06269185_2988 [Natronoarchaeum philippinense]|uniref:Uncharacterized protein n=1 Tax=Natronoarchaeum philippinense TaxID=558529 RepID=A0A285PB19_NATPI|nr:hypothetical protein [Natronoarchaeum philippinense]SNZ17336.1 hypothetical protein SAMN06269185_2988 [Natronoarchaeum philippinense]